MAQEFSDNLHDKNNEGYEQMLELILNSILDPLFDLQNDVFAMKEYLVNTLPSYMKSLVATAVGELYRKTD